MLRYANKFETFEFGNITYNGSLASLDYYLITSLSTARNLTTLNLAYTTISSLCFLKFLPELQIANISDCRNLLDADFKVLYHCKKLEFLNLSFNFISVATIVLVVTDKPYLQAQEIFGIGCDLQDCDRILRTCPRFLLPEFGTPNE